MAQPLSQAFRCAAAGIAHAARTGRNFKIELCFAAAAALLGAVLGIAPAEWAAVFACMGLVLGLECANTAIEAAVDLASPGRSELARIAKDCAAGGVLLASLASLAVGCVVYLPHIAALFETIG